MNDDIYYVYQLRVEDKDLPFYIGKGKYDRAYAHLRIVNKIMPIRTIKFGNLLDLFEKGEFYGIAHGCNCFHTMGAGIAGQISKRYPEALAVDRKTNYGSMLKLGHYSYVGTEFGIIYNLYTQYNLGRCNTDELYRDIGNAFSLLNDDLSMNGKIKNFGGIIGIPQIGAGIAGGDWEEITKIINQATPNLNLVEVVYRSS